MTRTHATLLLLLAAALVAFLAWPGGQGAPAVGVAEGPEAAAPPPLRAADAPPQDGDGPALEPIAAPPTEPARGPVRVRVLGIAGDPLPGVYVTLRPVAPGGALVGKARPTDAAGTLVLEDVPYDGSHEVAFFRRDPYVSARSTVWKELPAAAGATSTPAVTGPELVYRARSGLPWQVRVVDAGTGVALDGVRLRYRRARDADGDAWAVSPHTWISAERVGRSGSWACEVEAPEGYVSWESTSIVTTVSPLARSLVSVHPLRREVPVTLLPEAEEGGAVAVRVHGIKVAGRYDRGIEALSDAQGRVRIRGVPHLRDEWLVFTLERTNGRGRAVHSARIPAEEGMPLELPIVVDDEPAGPGSPGRGSIGIGGKSTSRFRTRLGRHANRLEVVVERRDGSPAVDVTVQARSHSRRTDARGRAAFENLVPGEIVVVVREAGLLPTQATVTVPEEGTARVRLREAQGGSIAVEVVDEHGRPLPFAAVELRTASGVPWVDLQGTEQRLDPYVGPQGRRSLAHVEPGTHALTARWGSRRVEVEDVVVAAGEATTVRVELRSPGAGR